MKINENALTAAHVAVEDVLVEMRNMRLDVIGLANGFITNEKDGEPYGTCATCKKICYKLDSGGWVHFNSTSNHEPVVTELFFENIDQLIAQIEEQIREFAELIIKLRKSRW